MDPRIPPADAVPMTEDMLFEGIETLVEVTDSFIEHRDIPADQMLALMCLHVWTAMVRMSGKQEEITKLMGGKKPAKVTH